MLRYISCVWENRAVLHDFIAANIAVAVADCPADIWCAATTLVAVLRCQLSLDVDLY
eukprot:SAG31_NODE_43444_length_267_cov_0.613095_1_plen_56_part_10